MNCPNCGTQLPDDAAFCFKCGTQIRDRGAGWSFFKVETHGQKSQAAAAPQKQEQVIAAQGVTSFKCPNCGAPLSPKFGEMVITCEYCGSGVALGNQGWTNIQKQSMLPVKVVTTDDLNKYHQPDDGQRPPPQTPPRKLHTGRNEPLLRPCTESQCLSPNQYRRHGRNPTDRADCHDGGPL